MSATSLVVDFAQGGNSQAFTREGWRGEEPRHRWSVGARNVLVLPPLARAGQFALTLDCDPAQPPSVKQDLTLELNGARLGALQPRRGLPQRLFLRGDLVSDSQANTLVFLNSNFIAPTGGDAGRAAAFAWRRLELAPDDESPAEPPQWLPEPGDLAALPIEAVVSVYQSLGQNCELGIFQRQCRAEPVGLLRFSTIFPDRLVLALRSRFAGIDSANELSLAAPRPGGELMGRHALYGLSYHIFKKEGEVDVESWKAKELQRLNYLARLFFEQMENDEKIFVRRGDFEAEGEFRALHHLMRGFNPQARLLLVQPASPDQPARAGRVERLAPNLFRGFLSRFADPAAVPSTLAHQDWLKVCATLYLDQLQRGRIERDG